MLKVAIGLWIVEQPSEDFGERIKELDDEEIELMKELEAVNSEIEQVARDNFDLFKVENSQDKEILALEEKLAELNNSMIQETSDLASNKAFLSKILSFNVLQILFPIDLTNEYPSISSIHICMHPSDEYRHSEVALGIFKVCHLVYFLVNFHNLTLRTVKIDEKGNFEIIQYPDNQDNPNSRWSNYTFTTEAPSSEDKYNRALHALAAGVSELGQLLKLQILNKKLDYLKWSVNKPERSGSNSAKNMDDMEVTATKEQSKYETRVKKLLDYVCEKKNKSLDMPHTYSANGFDGKVPLKYPGTGPFSQSKKWKEASKYLLEQCKHLIYLHGLLMGNNI